MTRIFRNWICPAALFAAVVAVYFQTARFGLVNIDDYDYLVRSRAILAGVCKGGLSWAWQSVEHAIWMPLTWTSYMIDFSLFGFDRWGAFHVHNLLLHALNACLVYILLRDLIETRGDEASRSSAVALLAAAFWALHPLRVESVAWLSSRKDVLSFAFEAVAFIAWGRAVRRQREDSRFCISYLTAVVCFALGALAKPSVMTYPLLQLGIDVFVLRRVRPKMYILPSAMMVAIAMEAAVVQSVGGATETLAAVPFFARLLNAMSGFGIYLTNTLCPVGLAPQCMNRYPEMPRAFLTGVVLSLVALGFVVWRVSRLWIRRREVFVRSADAGVWHYVGERDVKFAGVIWFCLGIAPFLGIASFGLHAFADRFTYIPAVGLSLVLAEALSRTSVNMLRPVLLGGSLALGVLTWGQVRLWRDDESICRQILKVDGDRNLIAHMNLGLSAFEVSHDLEVACREFGLVRQINEQAYWGCVQVHVFALCEAGRLQEASEALDWFGRAVAVYSATRRSSIDTGVGFVEQPLRLVNYEEAALAVEICNPKSRERIRRELDERLIRDGVTRTNAYLLYRLAAETGNEPLSRRAVDLLGQSEKTDYLQFRFLTKKET